jgi:hypothetical protein
MNLKIDHHSFNLSFFTMLRGIFNSSPEFLMMDIADEFTDITLIDDGVIFDTVSYPMGRKSVVRRVEETCNFEHPLALSAISMYLGGVIEDKSHKKLGPTIKEIGKDWLVHLDRALKEISTVDKKIPRLTYIIADEDILPLFVTELLKEKKYHKNGFKPVVLQPEIFNKMVIEPFDEKKDFFISLETAYINNLKQNYK